MEFKIEASASKCPFCDYVVEDQVDLTTHMDAEHNFRRKVRCYLCPCCLHTPEDLRAHLASEHQCHICDDFIATAENLAKHREEVHRCPVCQSRDISVATPLTPLAFEAIQTCFECWQDCSDLPDGGSSSCRTILELQLIWSLLYSGGETWDSRPSVEADQKEEEPELLCLLCEVPIEGHVCTRAIVNEADDFCAELPALPSSIPRLLSPPKSPQPSTSRDSPPPPPPPQLLESQLMPPPPSPVRMRRVFLGGQPADDPELWRCDFCRRLLSGSRAGHEAAVHFCSLCDMTVDSLRRHNRLNHSSRTVFYCAVLDCSFKSVYKGSLTRHMEVKHAGKGKGKGKKSKR